MQYNIDYLIGLITGKGYKVFTNDAQPYNLNIVGIRNKDRVSNSFNDLLYTFYKYNGEWIIREFNVTLDPGMVYRFNPVNSMGTAIIFPGQYEGMWKVGLHKNRYKALVQKGVCTVVRDNNRDVYLDSDIPNYEYTTKIVEDSSVIENYYNSEDELVFTTNTGVFGINCHKSGKGKTLDVDYYSAGCVVFQNNDVFDDLFIKQCEKAASIYSNSFTFTLIN